YRMEDKKIGLIEKSVAQKLSKEKPKQLLAQIGRSVPRLEKISYFPNEYIDMNFEAYRLGYISLSKLAELLEITLEEAKEQLKRRDIP
ncbi:Zn peptidase, partial [Trichormus variabilis FSR]|nr:Zn peptidase [Trichormus variabilis FSR]